MRTRIIDLLKPMFKPIMNMAVGLAVVVSLAFVPATVSAEEIEVGGEVKTAFSGIQMQDDTVYSSLQQLLNLNFFFPQYGKIEPRLELNLIYTSTDNPYAEEGFDYSIKKLYLKQRYQQLHLTVGRQPISWSFGSLINPVDYNLGAVVADEETGGKFVDALETYIPINWDSSISLVASTADSYLEPKWGIRGRTGFQGYDLSFNYIREPEQEQMTALGMLSINAADRLGISLKGDLGPVGIYGAVSHYRDQSGSLANTTYLLGTDYSYFVNYSHKVSLQLELLRTDISNLAALVGVNPAILAGEGQVNLLIGHAGYQIDDFSQLGVIAFGSLADNSWLLMPTYQNQLPHNLLLNVSFSLGLGKADSLYGQPVMPKGAAEVSVSYPF